MLVSFSRDIPSLQENYFVAKIMILLLNERFLLFLLRNKRNRHRNMGTSDKREVTAPDYFRMERSVIENHMNVDSNSIFRQYCN